MSWYVYIAECADRSLYTGITTNPQQRLKRHNSGKGSKYVRRKGGAQLIYLQTCTNKSVARHRELEIKSWTRRQKLAFLAERTRLVATSE